MEKSFHSSKPLNVTDELIQQGIKLEDQGRHEEALIKYRDALQDSPNNVRAYMNMGNVTLALGQTDVAISHYQKAVQLKPDYFQAHFNLGRVFYLDNQIDAAIKSFQSAIYFKPSLTEAHIGLAGAYAANGQRDKAIKHYLETIRLNPHIAEVHHGLGRAYLENSQYHMALECFQTAINIKPDFPDAYHDLGVVLFEIGKPNASITNFQMALALDPKMETKGLIAYTKIVNYALINRDIDCASILSDTLRDIQISPKNADSFLKIQKNSALVKLIASKMPGPNYLEWLNWLHTRTKPATYLEIGVSLGSSIVLAHEQTHTIGVDPHPRIDLSQIKSKANLYKMPSDDFFHRHNPEILFGKKIHLAFIDGLHLFEQTFRDFINVRNYLENNGIIVLHDTYPLYPEIATRNMETIFWAGDTWKAILLLIEIWPELKFFTVPAYPSGLTFFYGLNRLKNDIKFDEINTRIQELIHMPYKESTFQSFNIIQNDFNKAEEILFG